MIRKSGNRFSLATNAERLRGDHAPNKTLLSGRCLARQSLGFQPFAVFMKGLLRELMLSHGLLRIVPSLGLPGLALLRRWLFTGCV